MLLWHKTKATLKAEAVQQKSNLKRKLKKAKEEENGKISFHPVPIVNKIIILKILLV